MTAAVNIAAGEQVRWLPRRRAVDLCLPVNDYWLFDNRLLRLHYFSGDGETHSKLPGNTPSRTTSTGPPDPGPANGSLTVIKRPAGTARTGRTPA